MSVLIKGIGMPTGNDELRLIIRSNGQVIISHKTYFDETEAILVPPHGRLIDADAFEKHIKDDWEEYDHWIAVEVENRPTILEAEDGE